MIQTQSPCVFFALGTVHACSTHSLNCHRCSQNPTSTMPFVCACASLLARTMTLRVPFLRTGQTLACLCLAYVVCVLFARVCHVITSGDPLTNPLRVSYSAHCTCYVHHARCFQWLLLLYVRKYSHYTPCPFFLSLLPNPLSVPLPGSRTRGGVLPFARVM